MAYSLPKSAYPLHFTKTDNIRWRIQDFPERGVPTPERGISLLFPENCMKMKKFLARGGIPQDPLRSATEPLNVTKGLPRPSERESQSQKIKEQSKRMSSKKIKEYFCFRLVWVNWDTRKTLRCLSSQSLKLTRFLTVNHYVISQKTTVTKMSNAERNLARKNRVKIENRQFKFIFQFSISTYLCKLFNCDFISGFVTVVTSQIYVRK